MRLNFIEAKNFFNHHHSKIDLSNKGNPVLINGENGTGKSSLFAEALTFAIFGKTRLDSLDDCIRNGASEMGVAIRFTLNNQEIEIMREKKRGRSAKLTLSIDGKPVEELLTETQKRIDKMFGLSYNSFLSSVILKQEESDFFMKSKPDERKKIIMEVLDLNAYERLEKLAKDKRAELKSEIKIEESAYNNIIIPDIDDLSEKTNLLNKGIKKLKNVIEKLEKDLFEDNTWNKTIQDQIIQRRKIISNNEKIETNIEKLNTRIENFNSDLNKCKEIIKNNKNNISELDNLTETISSLKESIEQKRELIKKQEIELQNYTRDSLKKIRNDLDNPKNNLNSLKTELKLLLAKVKKAKEFDEAECPTCLQSVNHEHRNIIIQEMINNGAEINKEILKLEPIIENFENELKLTESLETDYQKKINDNIKKINKEIEELKISLTRNENNLNQINEKQKIFDLAVQKKEMLDTSILDDKKLIENLSEQIQDVPAEINMKMRDTSESENELQTNKSKLEQAIRTVSAIENEIEQGKNAIQRKTELENNLKEKLKKISLLDKLCVAFSKNGIPASIIATILPEIEQIANMFLDKMSHGRLQLAFKTTEKQKNGNEKDTLEIEVFDGQEWRRFESFSGGEQFRISLSIRLALSKVLARRANIDLELLILDEAATSLDSTGRDEFVEIVMSLRNEFSRIILMSHIPELASNFDNQINLYRSINGTKIAS